jgi:hypothetical protein
MELIRRHLDTQRTFMMRITLAIPFAFLITTTLRAQSPNTVPVPQGVATIDGRVDEAEWRNALRIEQPAGTVVRLMRDASHLYVGISSDRPGFASLCLATGEDVHVLHASAALGAVTYRRNGETWQSADTAFRYSMRNTALDDSARSERAAYLRENGWVGSTVRMSDGRTQELQIAFSRFALPFSVAMGRWLFTRDVEAWPTAVTQGDHDGCVAMRLVNGSVPQGLRFYSMNWVTIGR